jgi:hypothetical protein
MDELLALRRVVVDELIDTINAHAQTTAARREQWFQAFEARRFNDEGITAIRTACDHAVAHLDSEADRLKGELDALTVRLAHIDVEMSYGRHA